MYQQERPSHIKASGISGTKVAPLAGLSPYATPFDVYMQCTGREKREESFHFERGEFLEPAILNWYCHRTGAKIQPAEKMFHREYDWILAISDGFAWHPGEHSPRNVEIKSPSWRGLSHWGKPGTDEIPDYYLPQVTWEMAVSGTTITDVVCLQDGDIAIYHVYYDPEFFHMLRDIAHDFWFNHVIPDIPPEIDESDGAREWINQRYPKRSRTVGESTPEIDFMSNEYLTINQRITELEADKKALTNRMIHSMDNSDKILADWGSITYSKSKASQSIDYKAMIESLNLDEELIKKYTTTRDGRWSFRVNPKRGQL